MESGGSQEDARGWSFSLFAFYPASSHLTEEPVTSAPSGAVICHSPIHNNEEVVAESLLPCGRSHYAAQALVSCSLSAAPCTGVCRGAETQSHIFLPSVSRNMRGNAPSLRRRGPEDNCSKREVWASSPASHSSLEQWLGASAVKKSLSPLLFL